MYSPDGFLVAIGGEDTKVMEDMKTKFGAKELTMGHNRDTQDVDKLGLERGQEPV